MSNLENIFKYLYYCKYCNLSRVIYFSLNTANEYFIDTLKLFKEKTFCVSPKLRMDTGIYNVIISLKENEVKIYPNKYNYLFNRAVFASYCNKCKSYCRTNQLYNHSIELEEEHYRIYNKKNNFIESDKFYDIEFHFLENKIYLLPNLQNLIINFPLYDINLDFKILDDKFNKLKVFV